MVTQPPLPRMTPAQRWDVYYSVVEHFVRQTKKLPDATTVYSGVGIGKWFHQQRELQQMGMLAAIQQNRINALDILVAELNPTSLSDLLEPFRKPAPKPAVKGRVTAKPRPKPSKETIPPVRDAEHVLVSLQQEREVAAAIVEAPLPDPAPTAEPDIKEVPPVDDAPETVPEPEPAPETVPEPEPEPNKEEPVSAPAPDQEVENPVDDLTARIEGMNAFYAEHERLPSRKESGIRAGGTSLTWWTWGLGPSLVDGKVDDTTLAALERAPWWHLVVERADKLRQRRAAQSAVTDAPADDAPDVPVAGAPDAPEEAGTPSPTSSEGDNEVPAKRRRDYAIPGRHRRNPLAAEARAIREEREAVEDATPTVEELPELILTQLLVQDISLYRVTVSRTVPRSKSVQAVEKLRSVGLSPTLEHLAANDFRLRVTLVVNDLRESLNRILGGGYVVDSVSPFEGAGE